MAKKPSVKTEKFSVDVKEMWCRTIEVRLPCDATIESVRKAVQAKLDDGDEGGLEFDERLDPEDWNVRNARGDYLHAHPRHH